jgi:hypothetical protein
MSIETLVGIPLEWFDSQDVEVRRTAFQTLARNNRILSGRVGPQTEQELLRLEAHTPLEPFGKKG